MGDPGCDQGRGRSPGKEAYERSQVEQQAGTWPVQYPATHSRSFHLKVYGPPRLPGIPRLCFLEQMHSTLSPCEWLLRTARIWGRVLGSSPTSTNLLLPDSEDSGRPSPSLSSSASSRKCHTALEVSLGPSSSPSTQRHSPGFKQTERTEAFQSPGENKDVCCRGHKNAGP